MYEGSFINSYYVKLPMDNFTFGNKNISRDIMEIDDGNSSMIYQVSKFSLHVIEHYKNLIERAKNV